VCQFAFSRVGLHYDAYVHVNPEFFRPAEAEILVGDSAKALEVLGWTPEVGFDELIGMMVDEYMARLSA
jgi:GDPmannose 4,6-dehydratase